MSTSKKGNRIIGHVVINEVGGNNYYNINNYGVIGQKYEVYPIEESESTTEGNIDSSYGFIVFEDEYVWFLREKSVSAAQFVYTPL